MQPSLVLLAVALAAMATLLGWLGWFVAPGRGDYRIQAGFFVMGVMLLPGVLAVLALQLGAESRLARTGIAPHPSVRHAVGIAVGLGERPFWVFAFDVASDDPLAFYDDAARHEGWDVLERGPNLRIFGAGERRLSIVATPEQGTLQVGTWTASMAAGSP